MNYRLGLYEKSMRENLNIKEKLNLSKESGFDFMELSIDETDEKINRLEMDKKDKKYLMNFMLYNNFFIESLCLSAHRKYPLGSVDKGIQKKSLEIMEKAIVFSRDLGIRIIQLAGYDVFYEKSSETTRNNFLINLKKSCEIAEQYGIILAFETMETEFMNTISKAKYYIDLINSPFLKIYPDTGNITNSGCNIYDEILIGKGNIVATHLKETKLNIFREVKFGTGIVDFSLAIQAYKKANTKKFLAEMWDNKKDNWKEEIKEANIFLRFFLDKEFNV